MPLSVSDPIGLAYERTKAMLFRPFDIGKWFVMGFAAFLANLGRGGFNFNSGRSSSSSTSTGTGPSGPSFSTIVSEATTWVQAHLGLVIFLTLLTVCLGFAIYVVLLWLSSRGKFIFLDNVAHNHAAIVKPWKDYRVLGNNLMWFRMGFGLLGSGIFLIVAIISILVMLPDIRAVWPDLNAFEIHTPTVIAIVIGGSVTVILGLVWGFCGMCIDDFVVPLMYSRNMTAWPACKEFGATMLRGNFWTFVLYGLMKIVLWMGCGLLLIAGGCITCCIGFILLALPYIGTVAMLPIFVFMQCYALYFFEQFGPSFRIFVDRPPAPPTGFPVIMNSPTPPPQAP